MTKQYKLIEAEQLYRQGKLDQAETCYRAALAEDKKNVDILHALAVIAAQKNQLDKAVDYIHRALTLNPSDCRLLNSQGNIYSQQQDWQEALDAFNKAIQLCPTYHTAYTGLGLCLMRQKKYHNAKTAFQKALSLNPHDTQTLYNYATLLCHEADWESAIAPLKQITQQQPSFLAAWSQLATCYQQTENWADTINALQQALSLAPEDSDLMYRLGQAYLQQNKLEEAAAALETVVILSPHHPSVYGDLGIVTLSSGDPEKALTYFMRQLELDANPQCLYNIGVILMYQERHREAVQYLERCVEIDSTSIDAWLNLGALYLKCRDLENAIRCYQAVQTLEPTNQEVSYILQALEGKETPKRAPADYITHLFDHYANFYDTHLEKHLKYDVPHQLSDLLHRTIENIPENWKIVDLGCGTGLSGEAFKPYASALIGIDLSPDMIKIAEKKQYYDQCIVGDIESTLSAFHGIDCMVAADVLSYIGDCRPIFESVNRSLQPGGYWLFSIEKGSTPPYVLQKTMRYQHHAETIENWLVDAGFKILARENAVLRQQEKRPIEGYLYCCQAIKCQHTLAR